jgi:hypothetical protein
MRRGAVDAARTVERLLAMHDKNDVVHALDRMNRRRILPLVEGTRPPLTSDRTSKSRRTPMTHIAGGPQSAMWAAIELPSRFSDGEIGTICWITLVSPALLTRVPRSSRAASKAL